MQIPNAAGAFTTVNVGSTVQIPYALSDVGLSASILAAQTIESNIVFTNGYKSLAIGLTSSQNGTLTIQRFLDQAGEIPQDLTPISISLTAGQADVLNLTDNKPFQSARITIENTGGVTAAIDPFMMLLQSY
jgi:hypothetical protein